MLQMTSQDRRALKRAKNALLSENRLADDMNFYLNEAANDLYHVDAGPVGAGDVELVMGEVEETVNTIDTILDGEVPFDRKSLLILLQDISGIAYYLSDVENNLVGFIQETEDDEDVDTYDLEDIASTLMKAWDPWEKAARDVKGILQRHRIPIPKLKKRRY